LRLEIRATQGVRFLGVLGPSGSGKSSVVLAGLVPRLTAGAIEGSERWPVATLRPGDDPLKNLAVSVVPLFLPAGALPDAAQVLRLIDDLRADARTLDVFAQMALRDRPEEMRLAVVVDQFEEVFTHRPQDDQARARFEQDRASFFANLLHAAATPGGRVAVILTMRSDFLSACATFPQLAAVLSAHQELVGPMTAAELREAIEQPAFRVGCEVEPGLTERLLADVAGQPGALPLLQFALTEVWKKRDIRRLTLQVYTELGKDDTGAPRGIEGVLDHRAEGIYRSLKPEDQKLCRWLFLHLVQPGEGTEDTKRRVSYRELLPEDPMRAEAVKKLIRTLADRDARLITTEGTDVAEGTVEVAHEALIRGWTQLRQWVDAERPRLRNRRRLTEAAQEYAAARPEHKRAFLYSGARLTVCQEWIGPLRDELGPVEAAFLAASEEAERQRKQDEVEHERRLHEAERQRAEEAQAREQEAEARKRDAETAATIKKNLQIKFLVAVVIVVLLAFTAWGLALWANKQAKISDSRRSAALSESERDNRLHLALILAVKAVNTADTYEARRSLLKALQARPGLVSFLHGGHQSATRLAYSPDGKILVASSYSKDTVAWDVASGKRLEEPYPVWDHMIFSLNGKTLATYDRGEGSVVLWLVADGKWSEQLRLPMNKGRVVSIAFSPDGNRLATGDVKGVVSFWDVASGKRLGEVPLEGFKPGPFSVKFNSDGNPLAVGYVEGAVVWWELSSGEQSKSVSLNLPKGSRKVAAALSRDGKTLAVGYAPTDDFASSTDGVVLWDVTDGEQLKNSRLDIEKGRVTDLAFSPNGETLAVSYGSYGKHGTNLGGVVLWDVTHGEQLENSLLDLTEGGVDKVAFSPDGKTIAFCYSKGTVAQWALDGTLLKPLVMAKTEGSVVTVAFSRDGKSQLLATGYGPDVTLWKLADDKKLKGPSLNGFEGSVVSMAFNPEGNWVATGNHKGAVVLWDVASGASIFI
jgi:WD40 repeat protein